MNDSLSHTAVEFYGDADPEVGHNRLWFNVMRVHRRLMPRIAKELRQQGINDPIWHEILLEIEKGGEDGRLMGEIEAALYVPQYALSRHVARLEQAGFIRRNYINDGRRKQLLFLTDAGALVNEQLWPIYHAAIQREVGMNMSSEQSYEVAYLLVNLLRE